ncbi:MAG: ABC transporter ATP-binding protein [Planctomycetota bacterium]|jgi:multiple sugar transport system ATP-binding protein
MAQVLLEKVTKVFDGGVKAVDDFSLDTADGEFMVIVGPSGCGKTTTLRLIAGLEQATAGSITIGDTIVDNVGPKDRDVAMVFQNYALYPHMTVFQNMSFALKLRKHAKSEIRQRVNDTARLLGIEQLLDRKPKSLSGGQRQQVAVGRAIVRNPKVFLFDEPLSNLDAGLRLATRAELKSLHQKLQTTIIYVTHDQAEAMTLGDRICVMYNGVVQQVGSPLAVYERPINRFVAGFVGTPRMNFFEGRIDFNQGTPTFVLGDTEIGLPDRLKDNLASYKGQPAVLGVRPEQVSVSPIEGQNRDEVRATVDVIEPLGDRTHVYLASKSGQKLVANVDPHMVMKVGDLITAYVDVEGAHVFELGERGNNISLQL